MLQLEVAKRLAAKPGSQDYGALSVLSQYWGKSRVAFKVPASCFRPRPDVESAVVTLSLFSAEQEDEPFSQFFTHTVRAAFAHRRKTMVNSFREAGYLLAILQEAFGVAGIDPKRRAETMTVQEFITLSHAIRDHTT